MELLQAHVRTIVVVIVKLLYNLILLAVEELDEVDQVAVGRRNLVPQDMPFVVFVLLDFKSQLLSKYIFYHLLRNQQIPLQLGLQHLLEVFDGFL